MASPDSTKPSKPPPSSSSSAPARAAPGILRSLAKQVVPAGSVMALDYFLAHHASTVLGGTPLYPLGLIFAQDGVVPRAYGAVLLVDLVGVGFMMLSLGMLVSKARKEFGVEYPTLYANVEKGTDQEKKDALTFNSCQRAHQQALETAWLVTLLSLTGGIQYPVTMTLAGALYLKARSDYAAGYRLAVSKRYDGWARHVWTPLIWGAFTTSAVAISMLMG